MVFQAALVQSWAYQSVFALFAAFGCLGGKVHCRVPRRFTAPSAHNAALCSTQSHYSIKAASQSSWCVCVQVMLRYIDSGDDIGVALSPQLMYNVVPDCDIFNHQNVHFWEMMQPGMDAVRYSAILHVRVLGRSLP